MMVRGAFQGSVARGVVLGMIAAGPMAVAVAAAPPESKRQELEEIVVTGSRLRLKEPEGPSPVMILDRQKIESLGVSSVADVLKYIPQQSYYRSEHYRTDSGQFVELRGLGIDTTLVLINGRRVVPSASSVSANAFDLNTIPLAAVERVEVLSDAASAVYGADAVGGVVNIILKKSLEDTTVALHYGAAKGGAQEQRASLSTGWSGERVRTSLVLDYLHKDSLLGEERDRWRNQDFRRYGGTDQRSLSSHPGNITSRTTANLPGLPSRIAAVPDGSTGVGLAPADFLVTAGQQNFESLARYSTIVPQTERVSAALFGELDLRPHLTTFVEALYARRETERQSSPSGLTRSLVPATNAFNPFGVAVSVSYLLDGVGPRRGYGDSELLRGVAGLRGLLGTWDWEVSALATREEASNLTKNAVDSARLAQALASSDPTQALNVFQDGPGGSAALLASLVAAPDPSMFASKGTQASAFLRGGVLSVPAGRVEMVVGGEVRTEEVGYDDFVFFEQDRNASAAFVEVSVPLVSEQMNWPAVRTLSLKLAGRYDDYSDFGQTVNPQYGLVWTPLRDLALRVSYGTSFRPPSLFELYAPRVLAPTTEDDPRRNNEVVDTNVISGGNPALDPVEGTSFTTGLVWTPGGLPGLRLEASWWEIELDQRVSVFPAALVLANEARFPGRVVRAEPTPADRTAGLPGPIETIDISRINFGVLETSGVDVSAAYVFDTDLGEWRTSVAATWVRDYLTGDVPDGPVVSRVGIANLFGTIPEWRGVATLSWHYVGWNVLGTARYVDGYDDASGFGTVSNGRRIGSQTLADVQIGWVADDSVLSESAGWRGVSVTAGVANVFDKEPPYSSIAGSLGYDTSQGELRQRFGYLNVSKRF